MLGERTAEEVKMTLGSAFPTHEEPRGRDPRPRHGQRAAAHGAWCRSAEVRKALEEPLHAIVDAVRATLDQTPPELAGDIMDRGIVLTGGGALLRGLDERLRHETGMPVHVAEDPLSQRRASAPASASRSSRRSSRCWSRSVGGTDALSRRLDPRLTGTARARVAAAAARLPAAAARTRLASTSAPTARGCAPGWSRWCWPA